MKIQLIEKVIPDQNEQVRISEDLDHDYSEVKGISILDTIGSKHLLKSSSIDGKELFPKNFEVSFLQSGLSVPPNERFYTLSGITVKGNKFEAEFLDGGTADNYPYTLKIYVLLSK